MTVIDPTTPIGKLRLRVGDFLDLQIMPDSVYQAALDDCNGNLPRAATLMAQYILATLSRKTHQRLQSIEVYGNQWFSQYLDFVKTTILNPHLMQTAPIPYAPDSSTTHPIIQFQEDWNKNYASGTQSNDMNLSATFGSF